METLKPQPRKVTLADAGQHIMSRYVADNDDTTPWETVTDESLALAVTRLIRHAARGETPPVDPVTVSILIGNGLFLDFEFDDELEEEDWQWAGS